MAELIKSMFRSLSDEEETNFRAWARENYVEGQEPSPVWHPVVRDEWAKIKKEKSMIKPTEAINPYDN